MSITVDGKAVPFYRCFINSPNIDTRDLPLPPTAPIPTPPKSFLISGLFIVALFERVIVERQGYIGCIATPLEQSPADRLHAKR